ncbi:MAG: ABC transporter ATP-binding protein [Deltaproteobacteria bacterium]|nr:ABC transporter ATP-binding protein [Deltaproteobacteria bacterium]
MAVTAKSLYVGALKTHWVSYLFGTVALFSCSISEVLIPKVVQWALDLIGRKGSGLPLWLRRGSPESELHLLILILLIALIVGLFGRLGWRQLLARQTHVAGRELKVRLWGVLRHVPLGTFHDYSLGDLMNRATGDWNAVRAIHGFTLVQTLDLIFFSTLSVGCILWIHLPLGLASLVILPFLPLPILRLARREHDLHAVAQDQLGKLSDAVTQSLSTIRLQRATASEGPWEERLSHEAKLYSEQRFAVVKTGWKIYPLAAMPSLCAYAVMLVWGVSLVQSGQLTIGQFVAMQSYVLMLQGPLADMGECIAEWQRGFASFGRIVEIFNLQALAERWRGKDMRPTSDDPTIRVDHLHFAYAPGGRTILSDVSLDIDPGRHIGIFGPIGSGKSTLLSLIAGLTEAPRGAVRLAGVDVDALDRTWLAQYVTMVPQRAFLFAGTIRYNLELDQSLDDDALWRVLELVQLASDVRQFSDGLDSWVGEWGINLSGGQKQRLALARALLRRRQIILLDDCLSAVDAVTEESILQGLKAQLSGATVIWVAHRLSTLRLCDQVYKLDQGRLSVVNESTLAQELEGRHE